MGKFGSKLEYLVAVSECFWYVYIPYLLTKQEHLRRPK
jgi:hypothetical protein